MSYICAHCGERLPDDELCPCQAGPDEIDETLRHGIYVELSQRMRSVIAAGYTPRQQMIWALGRRPPRRRHGPSLPARVIIEIGERDGWICGICKDPDRPVDRPLAAIVITPEDEARLKPFIDSLEAVPPEEPMDFTEEDLSRRTYEPLAACVDHIRPRSRGGTDDYHNLQIAHRGCNGLKYTDPQPSAEYARHVLSRTLNGTPVPYRIWQNEHGGKLPAPWMIDRGKVAPWNPGGS